MTQLAFALLWLPAAQTAGADFERAMEGRRGTVVAVEVESGRLLGAHRLDIAARRLARPGSAVKPFSLLALLNGRRAGYGTTWFCQRRLDIGPRRFDCTHPHTPLPLESGAALAYSCNTFFAHFASALLPSELSETFVRVGLTSRTGLASNEAAGAARPARTEEERQLQALGEAGVEVTPLGLLNAYRKLAQRRLLPEPIDFDTGMIYRGLDEATQYGTARLASPDGIRVAGKTGTASALGRAPPTAWFAGWMPAEQPRVVIVVMIEGGRGGADAAPVARRVIEALASAAK